MKTIEDFYNKYNEEDRLFESLGRLEFIRICEIIQRYLGEPGETILDIGGATGHYSFWLSKKGFKVHLLDIVEKHIQQAKEKQKHTTSPLASAEVGDARELPFDNVYADMVLLMGPLYHLQKRKNRILALSEAYRVLKPERYCCTVFIQRYASLLDGLMSGYIKDPAFKKIVTQDLIDGLHENPTGSIEYFTSCKFHTPDEVIEEMEEAGFKQIQIIPVEGPLWMAKDLEEQWKDYAQRNWLLQTLESIEDDPSLWSASLHLLAVGKK